MAEESITVGVVVEKRPAANPWVDYLWQAVVVLPGLPDTAPMTLLQRDDTPLGPVERYYLGASELVLASVETANYRDNLMSGTPKLWVVMVDNAPEPGLSLRTVTADPAEGEAHTETATNIVEALPMAPEIAGFVADFVDRHHVEREFFKRKRDRAEPDRGGRRRADPAEG